MDAHAHAWHAYTSLCGGLQYIHTPTQNSKTIGNLETDSRGVTVQASTLGALEALLEYLRKECKPPVPVARVCVH